MIFEFVNFFTLTLYINNMGTKTLNRENKKINKTRKN